MVTQWQDTHLRATCSPAPMPAGVAIPPNFDWSPSLAAFPRRGSSALWAELVNAIRAAAAPAVAAVAMPLDATVGVKLEGAHAAGTLGNARVEEASLLRVVRNAWRTSACVHMFYATAVASGRVGLCSSVGGGVFREGFLRRVDHWGKV